MSVEERNEKIARLAAFGVRQEAIAEKVGVSVHTVQRVLRLVRGPQTARTSRYKDGHHISVYIESVPYRRLKGLADKNGESVSTLVRRILSKALEVKR